MTSSKQNDINILLLGETGVGKSTFINSFVNYLQHTTLKNAMNSKLACLIPLRFTVPNEDYEDRIVQFGKDDNEDVKLGNSSTQGAKAYVFPFENWNVRLIDTPGIGDARGVSRDEINFENILGYISQFEHLHGICFLMKPNVTVINAYFKFCIVHLLSRLEKSAAKNIVFIFTNSRSTFYRPGETLPLLRRILDEIEKSPPHVKIPCSKHNMFCVDNEAFKFLVATRDNIHFGEDQTKLFSVSWENSYKTCKDILSYICGDKTHTPLTPHLVQNTVSVNEARRIIIDLSKPLADICELIQHNLTLLKRHEDTLQQVNLSRRELTAKLYVPAMKIEITTLPNPITVCSASKCSEIYTVKGITQYHYKQRCHNPCYLNNVPSEIIGTPELIHCSAMRGDKCAKCGCNFAVHMHIYYESEVVETRIEDSTVKSKISTTQVELITKSVIVAKLKRVSREYENEKEEISKCMAKFAHFLKENSISVYNDAYLDYLDYLIEREKLLGGKKDQAIINHYTSLKVRYELEKKILDESMISARKINKNATVVSPMDVISLVRQLYKLPHTGSQIEKLHLIQQRSVQNSVKSKEYRHPTLIRVVDKYQNTSDDEDEHMDKQTQIYSSLSGIVINKFAGTSNTKGGEKCEGHQNSKAVGNYKNHAQYGLMHGRNSNLGPGNNFAQTRYDMSSTEQRSKVEKKSLDRREEMPRKKIEAVGNYKNQAQSTLMHGRNSNLGPGNNFAQTRYDMSSTEKRSKVEKKSLDRREEMPRKKIEAFGNYQGPYNRNDDLIILESGYNFEHTRYDKCSADQKSTVEKKSLDRREEWQLKKMEVQKRLEESLKKYKHSK